MRRSFALCVACAVLTLAVVSPAAEPPPGSRIIEDVEFFGVEAVDESEIKEGLATVATPRFLGLFEGFVYEYQLFEEALLARDLERIERYYRARGYYEAKVTAARVVEVDETHVRIEIVVSEGLPVLLNGPPKLQGMATLPLEVSADALTAIELRSGRPFDEREYERSKAAIAEVLSNSGYAFVKVRGEAQIDIANHRADVALTVEPGPRAEFGEIRIVGLKQIPEDKVRDNLAIETGQEFSRAELLDARRALVNLGVFASVKVEADTTHPESRRVPVSIIVEETALRTLRLGGGTRFNVQETSVHLTGGWEHRNWLGGLRRLSLKAKPGLILFPLRFNNFEAPSRLLFKNEVDARLRQPSFLEGRTTGLLGAAFNVYPIVYAESTSDDPLFGYAEVRASAGLERAFFNHHLYLTPSYNWQADFPFDYATLTIGDSPASADNRLIDVIASVPEIAFHLDFRDDKIEPHKGAFVGSSLQYAGFLGGTVEDFRVQPELRLYVPISKTVTFATRGSVGFLFPQNYGNTLGEENQLRQDCSNGDNDACQRLAEDQQKLLFRAFFSGGPNSNRGYGYRGVGPHRPLPYLSRGSIDCTDESNAERRECVRPLGGVTLWEASAEVRFPLAGAARAALFVDASDVTRTHGEFARGALHLSTGVGLRYATPVGPFRLDIGYRIPGYQTAPGEDAEGDPPTLLGLDVAIHVALGEAF